MSLRGEGRWEEAVAGAADPLARADLLNEQALFRGDADARRRAGLELDRAEALLHLGRGRILHAAFLADRVEDPRELAHFERALELAREAGDQATEAQALFWAGLVHQVCRGDHASGYAYFERSYQLASELGDTVTMSYAVRHLAFADDEAGRHDLAWERFEESARLREEDGFWPGVAAATLTLGEVAAERGRPEEARRLLERALELARRANANAFVPRIEAALEALE